MGRIKMCQVLRCNGLFHFWPAGSGPLPISTEQKKQFFKIIRRGSYEKTLSAIERIGDLDVVDENGNTALHMLVKDPLAPAVLEKTKALLKAGACIMENKAGETPDAIAEKKQMNDLIAVYREHRQ